MEKRRVYQAAREFHISSEALVSMLKDLNFEVKNHMSVIDDKMYKSINEQFKKQQAEAKKDIQKKKKISEAIHDDIEKQKIPETQKKKKKRPIKFEIEKKEKVSKKQRSQEKAKERKSRSKARKQKLKEHQAAVQTSFKKTMASISSDAKSKSKKSRTKQTDKDSLDDQRQVLKVTEFMSVSELSNQMDVSVTTLIAKFMSMGLMVSINQRLDMDTIALVADEFEYEIEQMSEYAEDILKERNEVTTNKKNLIFRAPVVTVMGHVDHGKTSLLDYIRKTNVVSGESGGITQHIGAYSVTLTDGHKITFIDTPGHEAFTAMRARGAKVTDIVILVIAADDGVKPQTLEAIDHAKAANVPIVIAINKIDLAKADPEKVKGNLSRHDILVEDWGGALQSQEISAKNGTNIDKLFEKVLLEAEMLELKANPNKKASGIIIDSKLDRGRGPVATILIQSGSLHVGDPFITGIITGRVRAMLNVLGKHVESAGPSDPVQIFGMCGVPKAGDTFYCTESEAEAREIAQKRRIVKREQIYRRVKRVSLADVFDKIKEGLIKELKLIIKADVDGSMEALSDSLSKITHDEVRVNVILQGVGGINENDVLLAAASGAVIIGFHVRPSPPAKLLAESENVEIKIYEVIYKAIEDIQKALSGLLEPTITEVIVGTAEVRQIFKVSKIGNIAGCYITSGNIKRNAKAKIIRDNIEFCDITITSLKRFKEDVTEISQGYECGLSIEGCDDIQEGDIIEVFELKEETRTI
ncbi:translation initiation factor IF-2 [Candidatus Latescibacterota bacterium]